MSYKPNVKDDEQRVYLVAGSVDKGGLYHITERYNFVGHHCVTAYSPAEAKKKFSEFFKKEFPKEKIKIHNKIKELTAQKDVSLEKRVQILEEVINVIK